jgi:hypothetical protein
MDQDEAVATPTVTAAAVEHLAGRPLVLRLSPRHGCCGGHALVPVVEVGPPTPSDGYRRLDQGAVTCFVDQRLGDEPASWRVDVAGIGRWRRLQLEGAEGVLRVPAEAEGRA